MDLTAARLNSLQTSSLTTPSFQAVQYIYQGSHLHNQPRCWTPLQLLSVSRRRQWLHISGQHLKFLPINFGFPASHTPPRDLYSFSGHYMPTRTPSTSTSTSTSIGTMYDTGYLDRLKSNPMFGELQNLLVQECRQMQVPANLITTSWNLMHLQKASPSDIHVTSSCARDPSHPLCYWTAARRCIFSTWSYRTNCWRCESMPASVPTDSSLRRSTVLVSEKLRWLATMRYSLAHMTQSRHPLIRTTTRKESRWLPWRRRNWTSSSTSPRRSDWLWSVLTERQMFPLWIKVDNPTSKGHHTYKTHQQKGPGTTQLDTWTSITLRRQRLKRVTITWTAASIPRISMWTLMLWILIRTQNLQVCLNLTVWVHRGSKKGKSWTSIVFPDISTPDLPDNVKSTTDSAASRSPNDIFLPRSLKPVTHQSIGPGFMSLENINDNMSTLDKICGGPTVTFTPERRGQVSFVVDARVLLSFETCYAIDLGRKWWVYRKSVQQFQEEEEYLRRWISVDQRSIPKHHRR